ncbi:MAG: VCBS repeat-containing protein [Bacteroidota bacterium]
MARPGAKYGCGLFIVSVFMACSTPEPKKAEVLYHQYCASCHTAPKIGDLPKSIWKNGVLPDMASRMHIEGTYQDPFDTLLTYRPKIKLNDWIALQSYIVENAPEKLPRNQRQHYEVLEQFEMVPMAIDGKNGALVSYLGLETGYNTLMIGDINGNLAEYDPNRRKKNGHYHLTTPITDYTKTDSVAYITEVGILDPSEQAKGKVTMAYQDTLVTIAGSLHRPVHTLVHDLNKNGKNELVVSEFGNETGELSLFVQNDSLHFDKRTLLRLPGCTRTVAKDMDADGKMDLIVQTSQGSESITILYQRGNLKFEAIKIIEFSPVYGSSWFESLDYNKDGYEDIVVVNGDNADKSYVHKPYHGMRLYLNDGKNHFEEVFFYPLNGATRVIANDFDQDSDIDFALISTFPDYGQSPLASFIYLENVAAENYGFKSHILKEPDMGRWFLMDAGDIDHDGDEDLILSSFTYAFTPVPQNLAKKWRNDNIDILVLKNKLKE